MTCPNLRHFKCYSVIRKNVIIYIDFFFRVLKMYKIVKVYPRLTRMKYIKIHFYFKSSTAGKVKSLFIWVEGIFIGFFLFRGGWKKKKKAFQLNEQRIFDKSSFPFGNCIEELEGTSGSNWYLSFNQLQLAWNVLI